MLYSQKPLGRHSKVAERTENNFKGRMLVIVHNKVRFKRSNHGPRILSKRNQFIGLLRARIFRINNFTNQRKFLFYVNYSLLDWIDVTESGDESLQ